MRTILFIFLCTLIFSSKSYCQQLELNWANSMGSEFAEGGISLATDELGNSYYTSYFKDTLDADPGPGTYMLASNGSHDICIVKKDPDGNLLWAKSLGGDMSETQSFIYAGPDNYIYLVGGFVDTVDFDLGPGTSLFASHGYTDIFVMKMDLDGNVLWVKTIGSVNLDHASAIVAHPNGKIYLGGIYSDTVDFDPGLGFHSEFAGDYSYSGFLLELDTAGNFGWVRTLNGTNGPVEIKSLAIDNYSNLYVTGHFGGTVDFNSLSGVENLSSNSGSQDIFIQRYDIMGNYYWTRTLGGIFSEQPAEVACDDLDGVFVTGYFRGSMDINTGPGIQMVTTTGASDWDVFLLRVDSSGVFEWGQEFGSSNVDAGSSVVTDHEANVYLCGSFFGSVDFDPSPASAILNSVNADMFFAKFDSDGHYLWAMRIGGSLGDYARLIDIDSDGNIYALGEFYSTVDFDFGPGSTLITPNGEKDVCFIKFSQCDFSGLTMTTSILSGISSECPVMNIPIPTAINNCGNIVMGVPNVTFPITTTGTTSIEWSFDNWSGNDTSQFQSVTISPIDSTVMFDGFVISANAGGYDYQWYNCITGFPIVGESEQSFIPQSDGLYQVEISNGMCSVTSDCIAVNGVGITNFENLQLSIFPNPTHGLFTVRGIPYNSTIVVKTFFDEIILSDGASGEITLDLKDYSTGIYLVKISNNETSCILKVVKQ